MKQTPLIIALAGALLLSACAPRIGTTILKQYPPLEDGTDIVVYDSPYRIPDDTEPLGTVTAADAGATTRCDSATMISLVKNEAWKAGGNAVLITEHVRPSFWHSSCHQFKATILRVKDFSAPPADSLSIASNQEFVTTPKGRKLPRFAFAANGGIGWRTNPFDPDMSADERSIYSSLRFGVAWDVSADYFFSDTYGIRFSYSGSSAGTSRYGKVYSAQREEIIATGTADISLGINYFGPAFVVRSATKNGKWIGDVAIGFGYLHYSEYTRIGKYSAEGTVGTFGVQFAIGAEYKFAKDWGIGLRFLETTGQYSKLMVAERANSGTYEYTLSSEKTSGVTRLELLLGVRFYIK